MEIHGYTSTGFIDATIDGLRMMVPDDLANRHRQMIAEWEAKGNTIPAYVPPAPPASEVKAEAQRRIELVMKPHQQSNYHALFAESVVLHGADTTLWPSELQAQLETGLAKFNQIKALRAKSNEIETMNPIPADFRNDSYWEA